MVLVLDYLLTKRGEFGLGEGLYIHEQISVCFLTRTEITTAIFIYVDTVEGTECYNLCVVCSTVQIDVSTLSIRSCLSIRNNIIFIYLFIFQLIALNCHFL